MAEAVLEDEDVGRLVAGWLGWVGLVRVDLEVDAVGRMHCTGPSLSTMTVNVTYKIEDRLQPPSIAT